MFFTVLLFLRLISALFFMRRKCHLVCMLLPVNNQLQLELLSFADEKTSFSSFPTQVVLPRKGPGFVIKLCLS